MRIKAIAIQSTLLCLLAAFAPASRAVLLYQTAQRNTWAPTDALLNSGRQYQGNWGAFLGTPIAPRLFITAEHVGGGIGQPFSFRGKTYTAKAVYDNPNTDLRLILVDRPFADPVAPIYRGSAEVGRQLVIYGRGSLRGADVYVNGQRKGWRWGATDGQQSWGTNTVSGVINGGTGIGNVLAVNFDSTGGRNEGTLSVNDSGGGDFINDGGAWKLAGVNYAAKGPYSLTGVNGSAFNASFFDEGGLWVGADGRRWYVPDVAANAPGGSYLTRVSGHLSWIDSVLRSAPSTGTLVPSRTYINATAVPEPGALSLIALAATALLTRRRRTTR
jgi:hypothetical protein